MKILLVLAALAIASCVSEEQPPSLETTTIELFGCSYYQCEPSESSCSYEGVCLCPNPDGSDVPSACVRER